MVFRITYGTYVTGPEPNQGEGPCGDEARRSAEEPEAPSKAPSTYVLLCAVPVPRSSFGASIGMGYACEPGEGQE